MFYSCHCNEIGFFFLFIKSVISSTGFSIFIHSVYFAEHVTQKYIYVLIVSKKIEIYFDFRNVF